MIQLPQLHESLLIANERLVDRARRRARLFRTGLISSAAVLSIGGAATAGLALWNPILGHEDGNRPSISQSPVPASQSARLGVLRRDQTAADRGLVAQEALAAATRRYVGVRLAAVRVLEGNETGSGLALVPVASLRPRSVAGPGAEDDALCVYSRNSPTDFDTHCFGDADVLRGEATGVNGPLTWGIVPDDVASVSIRTADGASTDVPVRDNAFTITTSVVDRRATQVRWLDTTGRTVAPSGGRPMTLPLDLGVRPPVPKGYHDCGPTRGEVVPDSVPCGPEAERTPQSPSGAPDRSRP